MKWAEPIPKDAGIPISQLQTTCLQCLLLIPSTNKDQFLHNPEENQKNCRQEYTQEQNEKRNNKNNEKDER